VAKNKQTHTFLIEFFFCFQSFNYLIKEGTKRKKTNFDFFSWFCEDGEASQLKFYSFSLSLSIICQYEFFLFFFSLLSIETL